MFRGNNFGDSEQTKPSNSELKIKYSNHVFNAAGENIVQYFSDSESISSNKNSKTRYINSAICVETLDTAASHSSHSVTSLNTDASSYDVTPHPHTSYKSNSTPFLTGRVSNASSASVKRKSCKLDVNDCMDMDSTPRCHLTYREEGPDTFRLSVASMSTDTTAKEEREQNQRKKQEAFRAWLERKEQEKREKARLEKEKMRLQPVTTAQQREDSYQRWLERKRAQAERRRAEDILKQYRLNERLEQERLKKEREKEEKLNVWLRKKEEEIKLMKTREERKAARAALEDKRRRMKGEQAYRDWLRTSKNKPLPVPLNQGELSMRGSVSQMYVNPVPWQSPT